MSPREQNAADEKPKVWTAAALVIGDEILSGRTQDLNLQYLANWLNDEGIRLKEARVVADDEAAIGTALKALLAAHDYVFTTGGIGPTHDDITVDSIAAALGVPVVVHPRAVAILEAYYGDRLNDARLRMARVPEGAELIENAETGAPGIRRGNLFILAGVPRIMQAMLRALSGKLPGGVPVQSATIGTWAAESTVAALLQRVQNEHPGVKVGSYPFWRDGRGGANFVLRSADGAQLKRATAALTAALEALGIATQAGEI